MAPTRDERPSNASVQIRQANALPPPTHNVPGGPTYMTTLRQTDDIAGELEVQRLVERLTKDRTAGRITADRTEIEQLVRQVHAAKADGANPRTATKDRLAWSEFCTYASLKGFDPHLRTAHGRVPFLNASLSSLPGSSFSPPSA